MVVRLGLAAVGGLVGACQAWMPTNHLVRWIYTDRGLKWGVPIAVVLMPAYFRLGQVFEAQIDTGGSWWWYLGLAWAVVNCLKFISVAIRTPFVWLHRVVRRRLARRRERTAWRDRSALRT